MNFYQQVQAKQQEAANERAAGTYEMKMLEANLTPAFWQIINSVIMVATAADLRDKILDAAYRGHKSYTLYYGNDLMPLGSLSWKEYCHVQHMIRDKIKKAYGDQFTVDYSERSHGGYHDAVAFQEASFTLKWQ